MLVVSNYHYIRPHFEAPYPSIFGVTPEQFETQLLLLKSEFVPITPKQFVSNFHQILADSQKYLLITFDDGLREQYEYALPILDALEMEALFFANSLYYDQHKVSTVHKLHLIRSQIASSLLLQQIEDELDLHLSDKEKESALATYIYDTSEAATVKYLLNFKMDFAQQERFANQMFASYFEEENVGPELYFTRQQLVDLAQRNCLGSHTHSHYPLGLLSQEKIHAEIEKTLHIFEKITNHRPLAISYPYGTYEAAPEHVSTLAKQSGHSVGFMATRGLNDQFTDPLRLHRFDCNDLPGGKNYTKQLW
jgi:peptidoglycan/xylan/chitin deacetylase (PgdA/CDA1 family)